VIPSFNEEAMLPHTMAALRAACDAYAESGIGEAEVIVVDNASSDATAQVARAAGVGVVLEPKPGVAHARNAGAAVASAAWLFFLDADTWVPSGALVAIDAAMKDEGCIGGAPATHYDYRKRSLRPYMEMWKLVARVRHMTQGVGQFVTAEAFTAIGGYQTDLRMAEDTEFNWRLRRLARQRGEHTVYLADTVIVPSSRRLDEWPVWKTVLMTNPLTTRLLLRSAWFWRDWRENAVR
jgi:glycosyltransferase involved in cell wall biosynthesis